MIPAQSTSPFAALADGRGSFRSFRSRNQVFRRSPLGFSALIFGETGHMRSYVRQQPIDGRLDSFDHGLRVDAEEHDQSYQGQQRQAFAELQIGEVGVLLTIRRAMEDPLIGPEQVERGEDHARGRYDRPPAM